MDHRGAICRNLLIITRELACNLLVSSGSAPDRLLISFALLDSLGIVPSFMSGAVSHYRLIGYFSKYLSWHIIIAPKNNLLSLIKLRNSVDCCHKKKLYLV